MSTVKGWCPRPLDDGDRSGTTFQPSIGGARRDRTADLLHAMQALSQLSYGPTAGKRESLEVAPASVKLSGPAMASSREGQGEVRMLGFASKGSSSQMLSPSFRAPAVQAPAPVQQQARPGL